jgi:hypothetical protein
MECMYIEVYAELAEAGGGGQTRGSANGNHKFGSADHAREC